MLRLEDFGITPGFVTTMVTLCTVFTVIACGVAILLWCLFGIGLARIAKKRGEEKEWYGYLPLLRFYTLGRMTGGCEKNRKVFSCLLPALAVAKFIMCAVSAALLVRAAAGLVFAAENMQENYVSLSALMEFPISYCLWALIITAVLALAYKIVYAISFFGAVKHTGGAKAAVYTVIAFICGALGGIFLYAASRGKDFEKLNAQEKAN